MKRSLAISDEEIAIVKQTRMNTPPKFEAEDKADEPLDKEIVGSKSCMTNRNAFKGNLSRKIVVRNFVAPQLSASYIENEWAKLKEAVHCIQNSKPTDYLLEVLYKAVETLTANKMGGRMYNELRNQIDVHVGHILPAITTKDVENVFLNSLHKCWESYCNEMLMICCVFAYLDRTYILGNAQITSVWDSGVEIFREHIISNKELNTKISNQILALIDKERNGEKVDTALLKNILRMLVVLSIYPEVFETIFLSTTKQLYATESRAALETMSVIQYLSHVDKRLKEENLRINTYLDASTGKRLTHTVEKELIHNHVDSILKMNFVSLFEDRQTKYLELAYSLFNPVPDALPKLCYQFNQYLKNHGKNIVNAEYEKDKDMVELLIKFKDEMDLVVSNCFDKNEKFANSLKEAFEYFINMGTNKPAEMIAKFVDSKLRTGNKESSEEEFDFLLDKVMLLFRFIHGKDVFEAFYKKDLAKRLLLGKSASVDAEKSMLLKLRQECGAGFTSKLEGMFKDMELSRELFPSFKQHLMSVKPDANIDMGVSILTLGYWPTYNLCEAKIPPGLAEYQEIYSKFYMSRHSGRKLQWQSSLGHCVLKAYFAGGEKELMVSFFQTLILLLFNDQDELSYQEILNATLIEESDLMRTLQSLACGKARVLLKTPKGKDVEKGDKFMFNSQFKNKLYRIKINQIQLKETKKEQEDTEEKVFQDRQYQIDAAIVRIMKTRKSMQLNQLVAELYNQIKFPATLAEIKKRIDSLIERDYVLQNTEDNNLYHYVA